MKKQLTRIITLSAIIALPVVLTASTAEELYLKNCKKCHGADGSGDTPMGKKFEAKDYTDPAVQAELTDEAIKLAITEGIINEDGKKVMMPFGKKLSAEEVDDLVSYVRSLAKE